MAVDTKEFPWRAERGERETFTFPVYDVAGELFPIDGWDILAVLRDRPSGEVLYTWPPEHAVFNSDDNTVTLVIPAPVSDDWTFYTGWYAVVISNPATDPLDPATYRILRGPFVLDPL